jgi:hypothetical protein
VNCIDDQHQGQQHVLSLKTLNLAFGHSQIRLAQKCLGVERADKLEVILVNFHLALYQDNSITQGAVVLIDVLAALRFVWGQRNATAEPALLFGPVSVSFR